MVETLLKLWINNKLILSIWIVVASLAAIILPLSPENHLLLLVYSLDKTWLSKILMLLILIAVGLIGSLIILQLKNEEKNVEYRRSLVASWRKMVQEILNSQNISAGKSVSYLLERHEAFYSLKPHLSQHTIGEIARVRAIVAGSTIGSPLHYILDDINRIEKEWHLI